MRGAKRLPGIAERHLGILDRSAFPDAELALGDPRARARLIELGNFRGSHAYPKQDPPLRHLAKMHRGSAHVHATPLQILLQLGNADNLKMEDGRREKNGRACLDGLVEVFERARAA